MSNRLITGILFIILGALIAFGPLTIFPICGVHSTKEKDAGDSEQSDMHMESDNAASSEEINMESTMNKGTDMIMNCHWTARVELGIGILIVLTGVLLILLRAARIRLGLSISLVLNGILALLIPTVLIGVCGGVHMSCRSLTLPALTVISSGVIITALVNTIYLYKADKKGQVEL